MIDFKLLWKYSQIVTTKAERGRQTYYAEGLFPNLLQIFLQVCFDSEVQIKLCLYSSLLFIIFIFGLHRWNISGTFIYQGGSMTEACIWQVPS